MPGSRKKKKSPKRVLAMPDLEQAKSAVLNTLTSKSGQRTYDHAITEFVEWYCSEPRLAFNRTVVLRYRISLEQRQYAPSTINLRLAAVRRIAYEAADSGLLSPELAAGIRRVKGVRRLGVRVGSWLTAEQGKRLLDATGADTLRGKRNHAMLSLLIGCGLRRAELLGLTMNSIQLREDGCVPETFCYAPSGPACRHTQRFVRREIPRSLARLGLRSCVPNWLPTRVSSFMQSSVTP